MSYELFSLVGISKSCTLNWLGRFVPQYKSRQLFAPVEPIVVVAHDGDQEEDDVDDSDEVLPVHTNQRQLCGFACDCIPLYNNNCLSSTVYIISLGLKGLEFQEFH